MMVLYHYYYSIEIREMPDRFIIYYYSLQYRMIRPLEVTGSTTADSVKNQILKKEGMDKLSSMFRLTLNNRIIKNNHTFMTGQMVNLYLHSSSNQVRKKTSLRIPQKFDGGFCCLIFTHYSFPVLDDYNLNFYINNFK